MPKNQLSDVNPETLRYLLSLLDGNTEATARLILSIRRRNPKASNQWHVNQAIKALESIKRHSSPRTERAPQPNVLKGGTAPRKVKISSIQPVDRQTKQRFIQLCSGHYPTALRIVQNLQNRFPDKSEQWCWEKAIEELKRDRL
jgi:hypothetical protein